MIDIKKEALNFILGEQHCECLRTGFAVKFQKSVARIKHVANTNLIWDGVFSDYGLSLHGMQGQLS